MKVKRDCGVEDDEGTIGVDDEEANGSWKTILRDSSVDSEVRQAPTRPLSTLQKTTTRRQT